MPRYRALVLTAAFSGLRRGELFGLRRVDVDAVQRSLIVEQQRQQLADGAHIIGPPKSEAGRRVVALPSEAFDPLVEHLARFVGADPSSWVFTGDKGGLLREAVWQQEWVRARKAVGLPDLHFHDLRHLGATLAASTGAGVKEIMYRIGHSSTAGGAALSARQPATRPDHRRRHLGADPGRARRSGGRRAGDPGFVAKADGPAVDDTCR